MVRTKSELTESERDELAQHRARIKEILKGVQLNNLPDFADVDGPDMLIEELVPPEALYFDKLSPVEKQGWCLVHKRLEDNICHI
jgi:hypothetical protein